MSGHSKWSTIKRKKGATDAARGKVFTKVAREIMVAAKQGGGDPGFNPRLRTALLAAKACNMPKDNQERAIKKGLGELEGVDYEEVIYEGRGPHGVAFVMEVLTDNRKRTVPELRHILSKAGGEMGSDGSATWMFDHKGVFVIERSKIAEGPLVEFAVEAGADDVIGEDEAWVVTCEVTAFSDLETALDKLDPDSGELQWLSKPESTLSLEGDEARAVGELWAKIDEQDDVQKVYCNAELPEALMEELGL